MKSPTSLVLRLCFWAALPLSAAACGSREPGGPPATVDSSTNHVVFTEAGLRITGAVGSYGARLNFGNPTGAALAGQVRITVVDLEAEKNVGMTTQTFNIPRGGGAVELPLALLDGATTEAELVRFRLDYALTWTGSGEAKGSRSAWAALDRVGLIWHEPAFVAAGVPAELTVFAFDGPSRAPLNDVPVTISTALGTSVVRTDIRGHASVPVPAFNADEDAVATTLSVETGDIVETHAIALPVERTMKLLLTTDKPLYQPGQTIHIRTLALKGADKSPAANEDVVFELEDPKGNMIARENAKADSFGVASLTFALARQTNLGDWTVRALINDTTSEKTVSVDRYVLPKFKIDAAFDAQWYRPGAPVEISGNARYFFGKPVSNCDVAIKVSTLDAELHTVAEVQTTTDAEGVFSASFDLPTYVVGLPSDQGSAPFEVELVVTDSAGQATTRTMTGRIARGGLSVNLIPDGGRLLRDADNVIHVVTTDPNGGPLAAEVEVSTGGAELATVTTDANGLGRFVYRPALDAAQSLDVKAVSGGQTTTTQASLTFRSPTDVIAISSDKAVYRDGDTAQLEIRVAAPDNRVWIDVIRAGHTVLQRSVDVHDGLGTLSIDIDGTMAGDLVLSAYFVDGRGQMTRDQRIVFVQPDNELVVSLVARKDSYLPGELATVDIAVVDAAGQGVTSAVGVQMVDEALFAIMDNQPGLLKVFFNLFQDVMTPRVTAGCRGCDAGAVFADEAPSDETQNEKARIALSALGAIAAPGRTVATNTTREQAALTRSSFVVTREKERTLTRAVALTDSGEATDIQTIINAFGRRRDPWGQAWDIARQTENDNVTFTSSGPDEVADSDDDLAFTLSVSDIQRSRWLNDVDAEWDMAEGGMPTAGVPDPQAPPSESDDGGGAAVRVRRNFPETLYVNPAVITDSAGKASIEVPLADSITAWRMTGLASSRDGLVGSGVGQMTVFQDFFVDINFPTAVTRNDRLQVPVALYNYLETPQTVTITLEPAAWFQSIGPVTREVALAAGEVRGVNFEVQALQVGTGRLQVTARGTSMNDAVERTIRVVPDGRAFPFTTSSRFQAAEGDALASDVVTETITIPDSAISGANELSVAVFPGVVAQVTEGMESLLRMPTGCFEQTTSSAWPNVLVTDYLQQSGASNPEIEIKAKTYITEGYQRLLTFECASGGFNWWEGDDPGNAVLTAVGVMMFTDTKRVAFVDEGVINRAAAYLASTQRADGSWGEERHLHAGNEGLGAGSVRSTAYIAWALGHAGREAATLTDALAYLRTQVDTVDTADVYTMALMTLAFATSNPADAALARLGTRLHDAAIHEGDLTHWVPSEGTIVGGYGDSGDIETTAVVTLALLTANSYPTDVQGAVNWLIGKKDPNGNWGYSTQATVLTLKALLGALANDSGDTAATVSVVLDGDVVATRTFSTANADIRWQVDLGEDLAPGDHEVRLDYNGRGNLSWQVAGAWYIPFAELPAEPASPLGIEVAYDRTQLATDDVLTVTARVTNSDAARAGMMMAEMGIPPGFELDTSSLDAILGQGAVSRYERSALKLVVYLEPVSPDHPVEFSYQLRALYPLEAVAPESETYLYYDRATRAVAGPVSVVVQ